MIDLILLMPKLGREGCSWTTCQAGLEFQKRKIVEEEGLSMGQREWKSSRELGQTMARCGR